MSGRSPRAYHGVSAPSLAAAALRLRELGIFVALAATVLFFAVRATNFATWANWQNILTDVAMVTPARSTMAFG